MLYIAPQGRPPPRAFRLLRQRSRMRMSIAERIPTTITAAAANDDDDDDDDDDDEPEAAIPGAAWGAVPILSGNADSASSQPGKTGFA